MTQIELEKVQQIVEAARRMYFPIKGAAGAKDRMQEIERLYQELQKQAHADHHDH